MNLTNVRTENFVWLCGKRDSTQQRLRALLFSLVVPSAGLAIDIVNTNSKGQQTPETGALPWASNISNDGNTVLFWAPNEGLIFDPGPTPTLFYQANLFVKTISTSALIEIVRRPDGQPLTQAVHFFANMDEPPSKVLFRTAEPNLIPGTTTLRNRIYLSTIGSFSYTPLAGTANLVNPNYDFNATSKLDRVYTQTATLADDGVTGAEQIFEYHPTLPLPPIVHSLRPDGRPSQTEGFYTPPYFWPDVTASGDGKMLAWRGSQEDIDPGGFGGFNPNGDARRLFVRNTQTGVTRQVLAENGRNLYYARYPRLADNGSLLAFNMLGYFTPPCGNAQADAGQGIVGINPITWQRECISIADDGEIAQGQFFGRLDVSADGNRVVFASNATNLGTPPQNIFKLGLYVRDRRLRRTVRIDLSDTGVAGNDDADYARISKNGRWVVFTSKATNLVPNDTNGAQADIFRVDLNRFLPDPSTTVSPVPVPALSAWASMVTILMMLGLGLGMRRDRDA